ncbi:MAG TPA: CTP synthase [Chloroflexi bacterium]|nr:CTP synthase [Chloroflexota bacterium]
MRRYIFCTGGVLSSVGKGVTAAAIGRVLKARGLQVTIQKLDPYINVDPGTMSPYQHGEVFVTDDGAETDLDLGHYERFIDESLTRASNVTAGQVYAEVIARERHGDYLGGTIQVIPHITDEIKRRVALAGEVSNAEVVIVEVGGTVGDIEGLPFLEALRQMRRDVGRENTLFIHVTFLPYIGATGELKTKPTQHSVRELRSIGIQPDIIVARADHPVNQALKDKIALFCDVEPQAVIPLVTVPILYEVPLLLEESGLGTLVVQRLDLEAGPPDLEEWRQMVEEIRRPKPRLPIAIVGKYVQLHDAYISVREALRHAALSLGHDVEIRWVSSEDLEKGRGWDALEEVAGVVVPGGFGYRGIEGKVATARWAHDNGIPYLGLCLGMQVMVIEAARRAVKSDTPNSTEFDPHTPYPVIDLMPEQQDVVDMGGTMRLGLYPCRLVPGTRAAQAYRVERVEERHRHRFEVNNRFRDLLEQGGLVLSGLSPDGLLVEIAEVADHPFMVGSQFHPEFRSRPTRPHPLFRAFVAAAARLRGRGMSREKRYIGEERRGSTGLKPLAPVSG